ncbi:Conserved_hypothetical protein [Hexamita inflata]|uniref:Uncharacterized protein n=1 Tax=Hexamita inflata TaxID=28002 RepID=A0ABP1IZQ9_9EUKA
MKDGMFDQAQESNNYSAEVQKMLADLKQLIKLKQLKLDMYGINVKNLNELEFNEEVFLQTQKIESALQNIKEFDSLWIDFLMVQAQHYQQTNQKQCKIVCERAITTISNMQAQQNNSALPQADRDYIKQKLPIQLFNKENFERILNSLELEQFKSSTPVLNKQDLDHPDQSKELKLEIELQSKTISLLQSQNDMQKHMLEQLINTDSKQQVVKSYVFDVNDQINDFIQEIAQKDATLQQVMLQLEQYKLENNNLQISTKQLQDQIKAQTTLINNQEQLIKEFSPEIQRKIKLQVQSLQLQNKILVEELLNSKSKTQTLTDENAKLQLQVKDLQLQSEYKEEIKTLLAENEEQKQFASNILLKLKATSEEEAIARIDQYIKEQEQFYLFEKSKANKTHFYDDNKVSQCSQCSVAFIEGETIAGEDDHKTTKLTQQNQDQEDIQLENNQEQDKCEDKEENKCTQDEHIKQQDKIVDNFIDDPSEEEDDPLF